MPKLKKYSATERQASRSFLKQELTPENIDWRHQMLKERYRTSKVRVYHLALMLMRLGIPLTNKPLYHFDVECDFVEKLIEPPKGYCWNGFSISKL